MAVLPQAQTDLFHAEDDRIKAMAHVVLALVYYEDIFKGIQRLSRNICGRERFFVMIT